MFIQYVQPHWVACGSESHINIARLLPKKKLLNMGGYERTVRLLLRSLTSNILEFGQALLLCDEQTLREDHIGKGMLKEENIRDHVLRDFSGAS